MKRFFLVPVVVLLLLFACSPSGTALAASMHQGQAQAYHVPAAPFQPAVSCSQNGCTGQDPIATGCSASASTVLSTGIFNASNQRIGTINLRFSSVCQTNWAQVVSLIGAVPVAAAVVREAGKDGPEVTECEPSNCQTFVTATSAFTNMVWAPDVAAAAIGGITQNNTHFTGCVTQDSVGLSCQALLS